MASLLYKDEVYLIQGAAFEVYRVLGPGFLESVYQEAFERELALRDIPFVSQQRLSINYKGAPLNQDFVADVVCFSCIIVELKAVKALSDAHIAQVINYLKATGILLGLLINFSGPNGVDCRRIIQSST